MRAIILAAGMGTRLRPLTNNKPKGLVQINGLSMVERQIINLNANGIKDIIIVTGYLGEQFEYLVPKYGVKIIHNDKYDIYNNIYTMYLVREYLADSYVLESDIFMNRNIIDSRLKKSHYFGKKVVNFKKEWILKSDSNKKINKIILGDSEEDIIFHGISYWSEKDAKVIAKGLEKAINTKKFDDLYWDDIVIENVKNIDLYLKELKTDDIYEIDSVKDLENLEKALFNSNC